MPDNHILSDQQIEQLKKRVIHHSIGFGAQFTKYPHDYSRKYTSLRKQIEAEKKYIESQNSNK